MKENNDSFSLGKGEVESSILSGSTEETSENFDVLETGSTPAPPFDAAKSANERETWRGKRCESGARPTQLYRHYDDKGRLLYVGISLSAVARFASHKGASGWAHKVAKMTVEAFPTRRAALYAEAVAIRDEKPRHNIHKPFPDDFAPIPIPPCFTCGDRANLCVATSEKRCEWRHRTNVREYAPGVEHFAVWRKNEDAKERSEGPLGPVRPTA